MPSNRSFGIFFCFVFLAILFYFYFIENLFLISVLIVLILTLVLTLFKPLYLYPVNLFWIKFGLFLNKIFAPIIIGIIYFFLVVPIGVIAKLLKYDLINIKLHKSDSYWIIEKNNKIDFTKE